MKKAPITKTVFDRLYKKAGQSPSQYRISCVALGKNGEVIGYTTNKFRKDRIKPVLGSGLHAEAFCLAKFGGADIRSIVIMRIGNDGKILPIDPCEHCQKMAAKMGVKIYSVLPGRGAKR